MPSRRKKLLVRLLVLPLSLVLALVLAEALVRIFAPQPQSWLDIYLRPAGARYYTLAPRVVRHLDTGETRWTIHTDADGFRCGEKPGAAADAPPVILLGDSFTFALGVDHEQSFAGLLQEAWGSRFRVVNTGVPGYGPEQYHEVLKELVIGRGWKPAAVVVVTYVGNDFHDCGWDNDLPVVDGVLGSERSLRGFVKRSSHLYRLAGRASHALSAGRGSKQIGQLTIDLCTAASWEGEFLVAASARYRDELAAIAALCRERGIVLAACIVPIEQTVDLVAGVAAAQAGPHDFSLPTERAKQILAGLRIPFCDAAPELAKLGSRKAYFWFDSHLTPDGHRVIARSIRELVPLPSK